MAVRFDASGDALSRTASLPTRTAFTIMGWFKITTDRNDFSTFIALDIGDASGALLQTATNGTTLTVFGENSSTVVSGSALTVGTWYHLALVGDASNLKAYINGVLDITADQWSFTPVAFYIGNDAIDEFLNGCAAWVKAWSVALSSTEVAAEMYAGAPMRTANLHGWWPCLPGATERLADYSGNGYTWTAGGTLTDEEGPLNVGMLVAKRRLQVPGMRQWQPRWAGY